MKNVMDKVRIHSMKLKVLLIVFLSILLLGLTGYAFILFGGKLVVNEEDLILNATSTIETTDGEVVDTLFHENRIPVDIEEVPEHVKDAFVAIEDRRFYDHAGVDFKSVVRAVAKDIIAMDKVEGASTITQQVAKNLFLYHDKTWMRKTKEVMAAIYLEREFSKDSILEMYMNKIYYGHGLHGIEAASQYYFSKSTKDLSITEGAMLAGLAQAPNGYSPVNHPDKALNRRNVVLKAMNNVGKLSTEQLLQEQGKTLGLNLKQVEEKPWLASYTDLVMKEIAEKHQITNSELKRGGYKIIVHVNEDAQKIAYEHFKNSNYFPGNTDGVEGAFVMMDHQNGAIIAALGGRNYSLGDLNRVDRVKRQPGSTIKPLAVYGPAMMTGTYGAYSVIHDEILEYDDGYTVTNVDGQYDGMVSVYDAIMHSKNTSAVWLLDRIGIPFAKEYLEKMDMPIEDNGRAIALGGLKEGLTPLQMAKGFSALANEGNMVEATTIDKIYGPNGKLLYESKVQETEVFTPQIAWDLTEILTHAVKEGSAKPGFYSKALAGKTGTTQHPLVNGVKDAWFVGYTPEYVTSMWMGYDKSDENHYLTGGSRYPTELTKEILTELDKQMNLAGEFTKPENVEDLPKPIELPVVTGVDAQLSFGGFRLVKGKITWDSSGDDRVVYRIYKEQQGTDERIGEVTGENEFEVKNVSIFQSHRYYVVPYNPLTKMEGQRSEVVELSLLN
ncbi:transglycosylase domain-containing protein [Ornithinibacillus halophilus]|uniref:Penicillin-binding protein 2A n=1 Tax=Ornithinibacillus halophilus TaxID=930117 RepID=A0A1M5M8U5_9BACI|nr:transglycosylase domain-containing protein [Ornithinibacillus halophilus]SHG73389.1 penicillin-binding protein 2A [Ornithinibacillus halophilus]